MNSSAFLAYLARPWRQWLELFQRVMERIQSGSVPALALAHAAPGPAGERWCYFNEAGETRSAGLLGAGAGSVMTGAATLDAITVAELYRKHGPSLYWVCMRYTRSKEDAEDLVQQVFMKVQKNLEGFRGQSNVYTWMYRITVNECLHLFRKRKFEAEGNPEELDHLTPIHPDRQTDAKLDLQRIMAETDPQTVEIVFLLYMEGLTQEEVVETMGISRTTVNRKVAAFKASMTRFR